MSKLVRWSVVLAAVAAMVVGLSAYAKEGKKEGADAKAKPGANAEKIFQKMDSNGDGKVSKEEYTAAQEARAQKSGQALDDKKKAALDKHFTKMDADGDGSLTLDEFKAGMEKHGKKENK